MKAGKQWVHFLGICGRGAAGVASVMKKLGWYVTGSDSGFYPPMPEYLSSSGITYFESYASQNINEDMDLVVVGGNTLHIDPNNVELLRAKGMNISITSWPELIGKYMVKEENLVVVGTYGKTSITALIVNILVNAGLDPTYMIGDQVGDLTDHTNLGSSQISVFEGDEHPTLGYSKFPKFYYFPPKYLVITSAIWDHFNIYKTESEFVNVFKELVKSIPSNGWIVASEHCSLEFVKELATCPVYTYGQHSGDVTYNYLVAQRTNLKIAGKLETELETKLIGNHNMENIVAACLACNLLGVNLEKIRNTVSNFNGPINRLQKIFENENVGVWRDVGQHPLKAKSAIEALKEWWPDRRLLVVLDPHASVYQTRQVLDFVCDGFKMADEVLVAKVNLNGVKKEDRLTGVEIVNKLNSCDIKSEYLPEDEILITRIRSEIQKSDVNVLLLSSGGFRNIPDQVIKM